MTDQLRRGQSRRLMYVENRDGYIDGEKARIGWVEFSKSGRTVYYRGLALQVAKGGGIRGNYLELESGDNYWVSGVKKRGSNSHPHERTIVPVIDDDAKEEYARIRDV